MDKRLLIGLLVLGVAYAVTGLHWLSAGNIVIRKAPSDGPVVGAIGANSVLYYPLCGIWIGLGVSMVALSILSFFSSNALYLKLSSFSFLAILLLGLGTLAAAIWAGP
ncbi:MAG: hypothetical protein KF847_04635 [Pirellulales bacterium]|nr:hypothetical protein [Pirellulales bacterium]